jgi:N-acetylglucosamine kinase-like BadF-type ATPase
MTRIFLGIDGGGTKTQVAICDESGRVLGGATGGASGIDSVGADAAIVNIGAAVAAARAAGRAVRRTIRQRLLRHGGRRLCGGS